MGGKLAGKVIVITGSTRGIGRAMAGSCATEGATVVVSSRTASAVDSTVAELRAAGGIASGITCDVAIDSDIEALFAHAIAAHGRIDVWVNNAGISLGMRRHVDTTPDEMRTIVDINLIGTMVASRLVIPYFVEQGAGVLINVSGRGGRGDTAAFTAAYAATKAAIMVFTKSLAAEHTCDPISVLAFMPGMVDTDFYGETMEVSPELADVASNIRIVLDAIGTPIEMVGPALVQAACTVPGEGSGRVHRASSGARGMTGGFKLMWARMTGRMKPM
jgi:NAD(P)-dependent dehydrogenase (short-subunit alcohol dehydrogenase family)